LEQYGIRSQTKLPTTDRRLEEATAAERIMEVPETDEALRAALTAAGVKPMICQEKGKKENKEINENKKRLQKVAEQKGYKVVFLPAK
jgi:pyruvate kinase